jgi:hypothetical protein
VLFSFCARNKDLSETTQSFLGFGANLAGVVGGLVLGAVAVYLRRKYKTMIIVCFLIAGDKAKTLNESGCFKTTTKGTAFLFFSLQVEGVLSFNLPSVSLLCLVGSFFVAASNPLFYEL